MKYNFGQKHYDVLLVGGNGGNLITTVLSSEQKHQLAMMQSTADVHAELKNIRSNTQSNVHFIHEMSDIKKYLKVKSALWAIIAMFCLLILGFIGATVFVSDQQPIVSGFAAWTICIVFGICFYFSFRKANRYHKQMNIMEDLGKSIKKIVRCRLLHLFLLEKTGKYYIIYYIIFIYFYDEI